MTGKDLLEAMTDIDDTYVEEYAGLTGKVVKALRGFRRYQKVLAACIALVLLLTGGTAVAASIPWLLEEASGSSTDSTPLEGMVVQISYNTEELQCLLRTRNPGEHFPRGYGFEAFGEVSTITPYGSLDELDHTGRCRTSWKLKDSNDMTLTIFTNPVHTPKLPAQQLQTLPDTCKTMRDLGRSYGTEVYYRVDDVYYIYTASGILDELQWAQEKLNFQLYLSGVPDSLLGYYPQDDQEDLFIERLLSGSVETVTGAIAQLKQNIASGWVRTRLEIWWFSVDNGVYLALCVLLLAAPMSIWGIRSFRYQRKHGCRRPPEKKRFWLMLIATILCVCLALWLMDTYLLDLPEYIIKLEYRYEPIRIFLPGIFQLTQLREGMSIQQVVQLLGNPQAVEQYEWSRWDLPFGGALMVRYEGDVLKSWEYESFASVNGWILPGVLLLIGMLGFCIYRSCFGKKPLCKRQVIIWLCIVMAFLVAGLILLDVFVLPQMDDFYIRTPRTVRLFHPDFWKVFQFKRGEEVSSLLIVQELGHPTRTEYISEIIKYSWELPLGAVFWMTRQKKVILDCGITPFASVSGMTVPVAILLMLITELMIYGYLFHNPPRSPRRRREILSDQA